MSDNIIAEKTETASKISANSIPKNKISRNMKSIELLKNECRAEGRAEGEMKGRMETARENAINMLKDALNNEQRSL